MGENWKVSTYSGGNGGNCVEVCAGPGTGAWVRDTKDREGGQVAVGPQAWDAFLGMVA